MKSSEKKKETKVGEADLFIVSIEKEEEWKEKRKKRKEKEEGKGFDS